VGAPFHAAVVLADAMPFCHGVARYAIAHKGRTEARGGGESGTRSRARTETGFWIGKVGYDAFVYPQ